MSSLPLRQLFDNFYKSLKQFNITKNKIYIQFCINFVVLWLCCLHCPFSSCLWFFCNVV